MRAHRLIVLRMLTRNAEQLKAHLADCLVEAATGPATEYARIYTRYATACLKLNAYREELAMLTAPAPQPVA